MRLLKMDTWNKIRFDFSQEEKDSLNKAVIGECICPRGCFLDENKLSPELLTKLSSYAWTSE